MTLINFVIKLIGPTPEKTLTILLLLMQVLASGAEVGTGAGLFLRSRDGGLGDSLVAVQPPSLHVVFTVYPFGLSLVGCWEPDCLFHPVPACAAFLRRLSGPGCCWFLVCSSLGLWFRAALGPAVGLLHKRAACFLRGVREVILFGDRLLLLLLLQELCCFFQMLLHWQTRQCPNRGGKEGAGQWLFCFSSGAELL